MGLTQRGHSALITGASSGIGAATAWALAQAGYRLLLVGRDSARLARVAEDTGGSAIEADLTAAPDLERVADAARDVDLLVNNAGLGWAGPWEVVPPERLHALVATNLTASVRLSHVALPEMVRRGRGHLVFVSSIAAIGVRDEALYAATKAGVRTFADSVRYTAEPAGIGVTTILPGVVRTPFFRRRGHEYHLGFPRAVSPATVAHRLVRAVEHGTAEVFVPRWLSVPARLRGASPAVFHRLASRFGP